MGEYIMQFGGYRGKSFRWMLENYLGYAIYIAHDVAKEKPNKSPLGLNKAAFREYAESFEEVRQGVEKREKLLLEKQAKNQGPTANTKTTTNPSTPSSSSTLTTALAAGHLTPSRYLASKSSQFKPNLPPPRTPRSKPTATCTQVTATSTQIVEEEDDDELCAAVEQAERALGK